MMDRKLILLPVAFAAASVMSSGAFAQVATSSSAAEASGKPSPYQGVSHPPADDSITTTDTESSAPPAPVAPSVTTAAPATQVAQPTVAAAPPAPEDMDGDNDSGNLQAAPQLVRSADAPTQTLGVDPDSQVVTYVPGPANALPEGTVFRVSMQQDVLAGETTPGTVFRAKLEQNLTHNGRVVIPIGSELTGRITYTSHGRRIAGKSVVHLRADEFVLPDGTRYHLHAVVIDTRGSNTKATGEGDITPKFNGKRTALEFAVGSGGGALVGAKLGGPAGAAIGSAVGAGVIGAHLLLAKQAVDLPEESTVVFSLTDPMYLNPSQN